MAWSFNERSPVYFQIVERIENDILSGIYAPDEQIPPVRQLATMAAVNPNTMQRALSLLEEKGILYSKGTAGRFVTNDKSVLEACRKENAKLMVREFLSRAESMSVTPQKLIEMIEEEIK